MPENNCVTILGVGNILLTDEGFGVHFIRWFSERYKPSDSVKMFEWRHTGLRFDRYNLQLRQFDCDRCFEGERYARFLFTASIRGNAGTHAASHNSS